MLQPETRKKNTLIKFGKCPALIPFRFPFDSMKNYL